MVNEGDEVVVLDDGVALSTSEAQTQDRAVVYSESIARAESPVEQGDEVVVPAAELCQGTGEGGIRLGELTATDKLMFRGETSTLSITAFNDTGETREYEVQWKENESVFATTTKSIEQAETKDYSESVSHPGAGEWNYQANGSNELNLTWLDVDPGPLTATPRLLDLSAGEETTTLSIDIANPGSVAREVKVNFYKGQTELFTGSTKTIDPNETLTYSTTRTKDFPWTQNYTAQVIQTDAGLSGKSTPVTVRWVEDLSEQTVNLDVSTPDVFYFGSGKQWPAGTYEVTVEGRYTVWGDPPDRTVCDLQTASPDKHWVHGPCNYKHGSGATNFNGPYFVIGGAETPQTNIFDTKDLSGYGSGSGTITISEPKQIGVYFNEGGGYSDNHGPMEYRLFQTTSE